MTHDLHQVSEPLSCRVPQVVWCAQSCFPYQIYWHCCRLPMTYFCLLSDFSPRTPLGVDSRPGRLPVFPQLPAPPSRSPPSMPVYHKTLGHLEGFNNYQKVSVYYKILELLNIPQRPVYYKTSTSDGLKILCTLKKFSPVNITKDCIMQKHQEVILPLQTSLCTIKC